MTTPNPPTPGDEDATSKQDYARSEFVILAYNVPKNYTVAMFEDLLRTTFPRVKGVAVHPIQPWENPYDYPRKIQCEDRETYELILAKQDIWVKSDSMAQASQAITFVRGDADDIPHIPFKSDEKLLVGDQVEHDKPSATM